MKIMPDFKTYQERDDYFRENAEYFTVVGKGQISGYQKDEQKTLVGAEKIAQMRHTITGGKFLIYGVIGEQSALVRTIG
jgi:hypothetical protein